MDNHIPGNRNYRGKYNNGMLIKVKNGFIGYYYRLPLEAFFWSVAFILLALYTPSADHHISFCLFRNLGLKYCPGCGLGRSISFLFHGDLQGSLSMHPLGIPAVLIISWRIVTLTYNFLNNNKIHNPWRTY